MLNRIILIAVSSRSQLRYTQTGIAVANFTIAVDRPFLSQSGEQKLILSMWSAGANRPRLLLITSAKAAGGRGRPFADSFVR